MKLPTVVVDVRDGDNGDYGIMTEYTCKSVAGVIKATEFRISSRTKSLTNATIEDIKALAVKAGVPEGSVSAIRVVDHENCADMFR